MFKLSNFLVDFKLSKYVIYKAQTENRKNEVKRTAAGKFFTELVVPVETINTERYNGEQESKPAACGLFFGADGVTVVGKADKPINPINTEGNYAEKNCKTDRKSVV